MVETTPAAAPVVVDMDGIQEEEEVVELETHDDNRADNSCLCSPLQWPLFCCLSALIVPEKESAVQLFCGRYDGTIEEPGCYCRNSLCITTRKVSLAIKTIDLVNTKILDLRGNPVIVSGIVSYQVFDPRRAALDVQDVHRYVGDQAPAVLKRIVCKYPYDSSAPGEMSLRANSDRVSAQLKTALQLRVAVAGVKIHFFNLNELSYAPEIAATMLKRQQAHALVDARRTLVSGASQIAAEVASNMGVELSAAERGKLAANLMLVLVSDRDAVPTISLE
ncbi:hypothetical protein FVE85_8028 [Porphyridium purpureum]|uniref:Band 7 domain-containing protein n=1 Tax=Porphyridium purpureum TaxID=35688 RepID=A0A5J4YM08_PORPP|nr:hypothetical protein FVE85_8028 [Porphyridium purpureum]|eukprot:POR7250..scf295_9